MKNLFINDKRVVIDNEQTYFPFQYKVNDIENIDVIGVPISKTIEIPRCQINDEIFGYLGDIHRTTTGSSDGKVSVSFSQLKKGYYKLFNESELVSEGIITVSDVDDDKYSINLIDLLVDKIERLNTLKLNKLHFYNSSNTYFDKFKADCYVVGQQSDPFIPTINIKEYDYSGTKLRRTNISSTGSTVAINELPEACNGLQTKSIKNYDINYAVSYKDIVKAINQYNFDNTSDTIYANNGYVTYDSKVDEMLGETYLICNKPSPNELALEESFILKDLNSTSGSGIFYTVLKDSLSQNIKVKNGKYELNYNLDGTITTSDYVSEISKFNGVKWTKTLSSPGAKIGEVYLTATLVLFNSSGVEVAKTKSSTSSVSLNIDKTAFPTWVNDLCKSITISSGAKFTFDTMPLVNDTDGYYWMIGIDTRSSIQNDTTVLYPRNVNGKDYTMGIMNAALKGDSLISYINPQDSIRTGDWISTSMFMPKVPVKDLLIALAKYFNLNIENKNGSIYLSVKKYHKLGKQLIIDDSKTSINTNLVDFDKMILYSNKPDLDALSNYEKQTGEKYAQKQINTGYTVKENKKEINYDAFIPVQYYDINNYAYDAFMSYNNNGYNRHRLGTITGSADKISFVYLNRIDDRMFITNDTLDESGMTIGDVIYDREFINNNERLTLDTRVTPNTTGFIPTNNQSIYPQSYLMSSYYTVSPYQFDIDSNITKSLEMNKPRYNFVGIKDSQYNESTTIYDRFFKKQIQDIYDKNSHMLKTEIYIDGVPDTKAIYNIDNSNYVINNLPEYDPTTPNMYEVELLKVKDTGNYVSTLGSIIPKLKIDSITNVNSKFSVVSTITDDGNNEIIEKGIVYSYTNANPTTSDSKVINNNEVLTYTTETGILIQNKDYYVRAYIITGFGVTYSDSVRKYSIGYAVTNINTITDITNTTATINANITADGGSTITERGVVYSSTNTNPTVSSGTKLIVSGTNVPFAANLTGLVENTLYYVRSYATNSYGTAYSAANTFTTFGKPFVIMTSLTNIYATRTTATCAISAENGSAVTDFGVVWMDFDGVPTLANNVVRPFNLQINNSVYTCPDILFPYPGLRIFRAFATNAYGTSYSAVKYFTIPAGLPATVRFSYNPFCLDPTTYPLDIKMKAYIYDTGNYAVSEVGFLIKDGIVPASGINYTTFSRKFTYLPVSTTSFEYNVEEFATAMNSDYTIVAYCKTGTGGAAVYGYTIPYYYKSPIASPPTLYLDTVTVINDRIIVSNVAKVVSVGSSIVQKGVLMTTDPNKVLTFENADFIHYSTSPEGSTFSVSIMKDYETTYYVRAFARNVAGIGYSNDTKEVTTAIPKPALIINTAEYTTGQIQVNYSCYHIHNVMFVGMVWSTTNTLPNITDNLIIAGDYTTPGVVDNYDSSFTPTYGDYHIRVCAFNDPGNVTYYGPITITIEP